MRDADEWAKSLDSGYFADDSGRLFDDAVAALIRAAQLDGVQHVRDTIELARDDFAKPTPTLNLAAFEVLPHKTRDAIENLGGRSGWVRMRDIGRALRSTPRDALERVLARLVADGVLEHMKIDRHQGKGQTTDAYRIKDEVI